MFTFPIAHWGGEDFFGFEHAGSIRLDTDADYLRRNWGAGEVQTSRQIGTFSGWIRRGIIGATPCSIFFGGTDVNNQTRISIATSGEIVFAHEDAGVDTDRLESTRVLRDSSAYGHLLVNWDTTEAVNTDRVSIYWNGEQITSFGTADYPGLNRSFDFAYASNSTCVGSDFGANDFSGFFADFHYIDGTRYGPEEFGRFNPVHGEWVPKAVSGLTYGNNGFHLDFGNSADLGADVSGNGNDFTAQGSFGSDNACLDVPAKTYPKFDGAMMNSGRDLLRAGLGCTESSATASLGVCDTVIPRGTWYFEVEATGGGSKYAGIAKDPEYDSRTSAFSLGSQRRGISYLSNGNIYNDGSLITTGSSWTTGDTIGFHIDNTDPDNIKVWIDKEGVQQGTGSPDPATGTDPVITTSNSYPFPQEPTLVPANYSDTNGGMEFNFGQDKGGFKNTPATGFKALNTKNYPTLSEVALRPQNYFAIRQWDGDDVSPRAVVNDLMFRPAWIELKRLDATGDWLSVFDVAGYEPSPSTPNNTSPNNTGGAGGNSAGEIAQINDDGFEVQAGSTDSAEVNAVGGTYQAWCWKNDPEAGIEIQKVVGTGANQTLSHSLGRRPEFMIYKRLDGTGSWVCFGPGYGRVSDPETDYTVRNTQAAAVDSAVAWGDTAPTDTQFTVGSDLALGEDHVVILMASIPGFSKMFSREGNGVTNGPAVYVPFQPAYQYSKNWSALGDQHVQDDTMEPDQDNQQDSRVSYHSSGARDDAIFRDVRANSWKVRGTTSDNTNGQFGMGYMFAKRASRFSRAQ